MSAHSSIPRLAIFARVMVSAIFLAFLALTHAQAQEAAAPANVTTSPADTAPAGISTLPSDSTAANTTAAPDAASVATALATSVSLQLANAHDLSGLYSELWDLPDQRAILYLGFGTPEGRAFLLQKIGDPTEPHDHRVTLTEALRVDGPIYQSKFSHITPASWGVTGAPDAKNSSYFTRITQLALANAGDEELSLALLQALNWLATGNPANRDPNIQADWDDAADILRQLYTQTKSERVRYTIEQITALIGSTAYDKLGSKSGPVLSMITQAKKYLPPSAAGASSAALAPFVDLVVGYEYQTLPGAPNITKAVVVLEPTHPGPAYAMPQHVVPLTPGTISGSGTAQVVIPQNIAHGQYRVYYLFLADRLDVGTGQVVKDATLQPVRDVVSAGHGVTTIL